MLGSRLLEGETVPPVRWDMGDAAGPELRGTAPRPEMDVEWQGVP